MRTLDIIVEIPLESVQTEKAKNQGTKPGCCLICGKPIKNKDTAKMVHLLTNGNLVSTDEPMDNSQGGFEIGSDCAKKLVLKFFF